MKTLIEFYLSLAEECQAKGDAFGACYYRQRAFEIECIEGD